MVLERRVQYEADSLAYAESALPHIAVKRHDVLWDIALCGGFQLDGAKVLAPPPSAEAPQLRIEQMAAARRLRYPKRWLLRTSDADVDVTLAMPALKDVVVVEGGVAVADPKAADQLTRRPRTILQHVLRTLGNGPSDQFIGLIGKSSGFA